MGSLAGHIDVPVWLTEETTGAGIGGAVVANASEYDCVAGTGTTNGVVGRGGSAKENGRTTGGSGAENVDSAG